MPANSHSISHESDGDDLLPEGRARRMVRSELLGQHTHSTSVGVDVHVWMRGGTFLARGRISRSAFGERLGDSVESASRQLRHLLVEIENGTFIRPSDRPKRHLRRGLPAKIDVRALCDAFLTEKRRILGKVTCRTYYSRLVPLIEFAEMATTKRRYSQVLEIDRQFVVDLREALHSRMVARNGRVASCKKRMSIHQIHNVLDCCRTMFNWARKPEVNLLPMSYPNPFTDDLVGRSPKRDPLKPPAFPFPLRLVMVEALDEWQLLHLAWMLVLPLRPEDFAGLLISEVDVSNHQMKFTTRFGGADFNKGKQQFICPYPTEMAWLVELCIGKRTEGPFLRQRQIFAGNRRPSIRITNVEDVVDEVNAALAAADGTELQSPQDYKLVTRRTLSAMGAISPDGIRKELHSVFERAGCAKAGRSYELRHSIQTEMEGAGVGHLTQRYVTGHQTNDILHRYASLSPQDQMRKYFDTLHPLFDAFRQRAVNLQLTGVRYP